MSRVDRPFVFPVKRLENDRARLEPFAVASHSKLFVDGSRDQSQVFDFVTYGPFENVEHFEDKFYWPKIGNDETAALWSIFAKWPISAAKEEHEWLFAGIVALDSASVTNGVAEIAHVIVLPKFHRSFVTSNAVGLLLCYTMDPPPAGLGLRRSIWQAHGNNHASRTAATKMGYTFEGILRFQRVMPEGKPTNDVDISPYPSVIANLGSSRDTALFAHYCDEWAKKKDVVVRRMGGRA